MAGVAAASNSRRERVGLWERERCVEGRWEMIVGSDIVRFRFRPRWWAERGRDCGGQGGVEVAASPPKGPTEPSAAVWPSVLDSHDSTAVCVSSVSIAPSVMCWSRWSH